MSSKPLPNSESLLDELQATLAHGTVARRVETLRRVTDLFISGAVEFSDDQVGLFDDVFQCLIHHIETSAKALLSNRLAPVDRAPPLTVRALAFDDLIEVAAPGFVHVGTARRRNIDRDRAKQEPGAPDGDFDPQGTQRRGHRRIGAAGQ